MSLSPYVIPDGGNPYGNPNSTNQFFDGYPAYGDRHIAYGGALYVIFFDPEASPAGIKICVSKSTNNGVTWATLDTANQPLPDLDSAAMPTACVPQGSKFRMVYLHKAITGSTKVAEVRIYTFDCSTELWEAGYVAGPTQTLTTSWTAQDFFRDACLRGTDEILVGWAPAPSGGGDGLNSYIDIYNTTSETWTTTDLLVFPETAQGTAVEPLLRRMVWDGTYVHLFSEISKDSASFGRVRNHRTLDSVNGLSAPANMLTAVNPAWPDPMTPYGDPNYVEYGVGWGTANFYISVIVHDGKVFMAQAANTNTFADPGGETFWYAEHRQVVCFVADAGDPSPSWSTELICDTDATFNPYLFVSDGTLHCIFNSDNPTTGDDAGIVYYSKRIADVWTDEGTLYSYFVRPPADDPGPTPTPSAFGLVRDMVGIPDVTNSLGFSAMVGFAYGDIGTVWFLTDSPCCCSNFAF
jgi:hypothetical protein